jgi:hypothetical protein
MARCQRETRAGNSRPKSKEKRIPHSDTKRLEERGKAGFESETP